jgi:hypothetical protein
VDESRAFKKSEQSLELMAFKSGAAELGTRVAPFII